MPGWEDGQTTPPEPVGGGRAITSEQFKALEPALRGMPQVDAVTFVSRQEAFTQLRRQLPNVAGMSVADMPESFRLELVPGADRKAVIAAVKVLPGVAVVVDKRCLADSFIKWLLGGRDHCIF